MEVRAIKSIMEIDELIQRRRSISSGEAEENKFSFKGKIKEKRVQIVAGYLIGKVLHTKGVNTKGPRMALNEVCQTKKGC